MMKGDLDAWQLHDLPSALFCSTCSLGINEVLHSLENGTDHEIIANNAINLCIDLGIGTEVFCENFVNHSQVTCDRQRPLQQPPMNIVKISDSASIC